MVDGQDEGSGAVAPEGGVRSVFPGFADVAPDVAELVDLLAARRRAQRLSQAEVAQRMGTSQPAVARLESGRGDVRLSTLRRYAAALGQSVHFAVVTPPDSPDATDAP